MSNINCSISGTQVAHDNCEKPNISFCHQCSKMVQITQTDEEIKIVVELNRLVTRKPDVILLPTYLKFNSPPIFFERHLAQEIDDVASYCRVFKNEARIILIKKEKGMWPELFQKLSKDELFKRRLEISDQIVERNKERDKKTLERFEQKRRSEIAKEVQRETAMQERVKQFQEKACKETLMIGKCVETHSKKSNTNDTGTRNANGNQSVRLSSPPVRPRSLAAVRNVGTINVNFSKFTSYTPKRESQEGVPRPFIVEDKCQSPEKAKEPNHNNLK